jgi:mRNA interferase MazF
MEKVRANECGHERWIEEWLSNIEAVEISRWPKKFKPTIKATPRVGDIYWCNFHDETEIELPEMWKTRPCVVVSRKNSLYGKVTVLPFSTSRSNADDPMTIEASRTVQERLDRKRTWILCDHPCTVATSRLNQVKGGVPKLTSTELKAVLTLMVKSLAAPLP